MMYFICLLLPLLFSNCGSSKTVRAKQQTDRIDSGQVSFGDSSTVAKTPLSTDTIRNYIKLSISGNYIDLINLSFCNEQLLGVLNENKSLEDTFLTEISNYPRRWGTQYWDKIAVGQLYFFNRNIINDSTLRRKYPGEVKMVNGKLQSFQETGMSPEVYRSIIKLFGTADGAQYSELSSSYYSLLITNSCDFLASVGNDSVSKKNYSNWIKKIESFEFVAMRDDNVPPSILSKKRFYILNELSKCPDSPLKMLTTNNVKNARIRVIN